MYKATQKLFLFIERLHGEEVGLYEIFLSETGKASLNRVEAALSSIEGDIFAGELTELYAIAFSLANFSDQHPVKIPKDVASLLLRFVAEQLEA